MAYHSQNNEPAHRVNGPDIRTGGRAKNMAASPIHPGMKSQTRGTLGGPTQGNPPDASSPMPTDHEKQHGDKLLPVPKMAFGMKSDPERGTFDVGLASAVFGEARLPAKGR